MLGLYSTYAISSTKSHLFITALNVVFLSENQKTTLQEEMFRRAFMLFAKTNYTKV